MKVINVSKLRHTGIHSVHPTRIVRDLETGDCWPHINVSEDDWRILIRDHNRQMMCYLDEQFRTTMRKSSTGTETSLGGQ